MGAQLDRPVGTRRDVGDLLADATGMGAVTLVVADLARTTGFYRDGVGLQVLAEDAAGVVLGRGARPLVRLRHEPDLPPARPGQAGLFHTAILFPSESALAVAVASVARTAPTSFVGSADHLVSQAFYFTDPEGNGLELYVDRPRTQWQWVDGSVAMDSRRLDPNAFLRSHLADVADPVDGTADVGHVHLQVGDIPLARQFYVDVLGFEVTHQLDTALFVSAGGYHHHMAMNTWNSAGAGPRASTLGLGEVAITVPGRPDLDAALERLRARQVPVADDGARLVLADPWGNRVTLTAGRSTTR